MLKCSVNSTFLCLMYIHVCMNIVGESYFEQKRNMREKANFFVCLQAKSQHVFWCSYHHQSLKWYHNLVVYRYIAERTILRGDDFIGRLFYPLRSIPNSGEEKTFVLYSHSGKTQHGYITLHVSIGAKQKKVPLEVCTYSWQYCILPSIALPHPPCLQQPHFFDVVPNMIDMVTNFAQTAPTCQTFILGKTLNCMVLTLSFRHVCQSTRH